MASEEESGHSTGDSSGAQFSTRSSTPRTRSKKNLEDRKRKQDERQQRQDEFWSLLSKMDRERQELRTCVLNLTKAVNVINGFGDGDEEIEELNLPVQPRPKRQKTKTTHQVEPNIRDVSAALAAKFVTAPVPASAPNSSGPNINDSAMDLTETKVEVVKAPETEDEDTGVSQTPKPESSIEQGGPENEEKTDHTIGVTDTTGDIEVHSETEDKKPITESERLASLTDKELEEEMQVALAARNRALANKLWDLIEERIQQKKNLA